MIIMTSSDPSSPGNAEFSATPQKLACKRKGMSMERCMVMFTAFFGLGILLLVLLPEGSPMRGAAMGVYSIVVFWAMYRFGM
jgi:hypothetical protein